MGTVGVVVVHPGIELTLGSLGSRERRGREELLVDTLVKRSILPVVVGELGAVSRCEIPFSMQMRSSTETRHGGWVARESNPEPTD